MLPDAAGAVGMQKRLCILKAPGRASPLRKQERTAKGRREASPCVSGSSSCCTKGAVSEPGERVSS